MEHLNNTELLRQALDVNRSFDAVIWALRRRILPALKKGIAQPPRDDVYWQKECGFFQVHGENTFRPQDDGTDESNFMSWTKRGEKGETHVGLSYAVYAEHESEMVKTGEYKQVIPRPECRVYSGEWCYLESHKDVVIREDAYFRCVNNIAENSFLNTLKKSSNYRLFCKSVSDQRVSLHAELVGSHDDKWLLEVACLRVLSGGIELYFDPLRQKDDRSAERKANALEAGLGKLNKPSDKTISAAKRLVRGINEDGGTLAGLEGIEKIIRGEPFASVNRTTPARAMVREMCLLSKDLLDTQNGLKNRFPVSAIQHAFNLIGEDKSKTAIQNYQALYDDSGDQSALSNGYDPFRSHEMPF